MQVILHADDFGMSPAQSLKILGACDAYPQGHGSLNSLSILANSPRFDDCASLLDPIPAGLRIGIHLNIVEGHCVADPAGLDMLVDSSGLFRCSFIDILKASKGPQREALQRQLETELSAQIARVVRRFPQMHDHLRLDSHQHFHLIPAVFDAILAVVEREGYQLEYLRIPAEATTPFLAPGIFFTIKPINWAKHIVLNHLWKQDRPKLSRYQQISALFCGILFSGHMDARRVARVAPALIKRAQEQGMDMEFLFHPGGCDDASECLNPSLAGFTAFYLSSGRTVEAQALQTLIIAEDGSAPGHLILKEKVDA